MNKPIDISDFELKPLPNITLNCKEHGDYTSTQKKMRDTIFTQKCPKCLKTTEKKAEKIIQESETKANKDRKEAFFRESGLPKRYWDIVLEDIIPYPEQKPAYAACLKFSAKFDEMSAKGQCLIFCGGIGTGKTMLISALIQSIGFGCYIRAVDISRNVRGAYSSNDSELSVIDQMARQPLLVIDEIGVQTNTKAEALLITDLIDRRYGEMLPTILLSNLDKEGIKQSLGERAFSRIMQNGALIPITGKDNRGGG